MYSAIILAGGIGSRMNQTLPKQFLALAGKPMILHTLERLEEIDEITEIIVVCHPEYKKMMQFYIDSYMLKKNYIIVDGGKTRQESTYNGLSVATNDNVIIHEAARPFVTTEEFRSLIHCLSPNATYGIDIPFTVSVRSEDTISQLLNRRELVNIQLPQKFEKKTLMEVHQKAVKEGLTFTEDASILYYYKQCPITILEGTPNNIKITNAVDLLIGEAIYKDYIVRRY